MFALELHATLARVFVYCAAVGVFALIIAELVGSRDGAVKVAHPEWAEIIRPLPAFVMSIPDFDTPRYSIWRQANGSGRKDIFNFGEPGGATAVIEIIRPGPVEQTDDDITASISELRLSGPRTSPNTIDTKFGTVRTEDFVEDARSCVRISHKLDEPRFEITGVFCSAGRDLVDHGMIACALDRLSLLTAGGDPRLAAFFARAELRRNFCGQNSVFIAATPKRTDWIDASRGPKLRRASIN